MPVGSNKCTRCSALHKACDAVPDAVTPAARQLLAAAAAYVEQYDEDDESDEAVAALAALVEMQHDFTRRAEAAVRLRRRFGMNRRPTSTMEVGLAILESNHRIEALLGELVALARVSVSSPSLPHLCTGLHLSLTRRFAVVWRSRRCRCCSSCCFG
jgi:hypothetical protein